MNEALSRIVAELFEKSKEGEDLPAKIRRLRGEIKKVIENEETIFGKFRELVDSFRDIIPEEKQRYNAAIKALSTTSKLSRIEIVTAINTQLEELKLLEKGIMPALPDWRDDLKTMETRSQEIKGEIATLRERIAQMESEEKGILKSLTTRKKDMELAEKAVRDLFSDIGAEITYVKKKVEDAATESAAPQPVPQSEPVKAYATDEKKGGVEQKVEISEPAAKKDSEWEKKCPMCGGRMNFHINEEMWQCYSCAYEERK